MPVKTYRLASLVLAAFLHLGPLATRTLPALPSLATSPAGIFFKWVLGALVVGGSMHAVSAATATLVSASTVTGKTGTRLSYQIRISDGKNRLPESWLIGGQTFGKTGSTTVGMPPGLSLALSTAIISGIPTSAGGFKVPITAYEHPNRTGAKLAFTLTFNIAGGASPPTVGTAPVGGTVTEGDPFTFTVSATGDAPLSYQWFHDSVAVTGATDASLAFLAVAMADAGAYTVTVSNGAGSVTTVPVDLVVHEALKAPVIASQSSAVGVHIGEPLSLAVTATGSGPLAYRWMRNGATLGGAFEGSELKLDAVGVDDAGSYTVEVTGPGGAVTSAPIDVAVRALTLGSVSVDGGTVRLTVSTWPGRHYVLEAATSVPVSGWNTALEFTATGDTSELAQNVSSASSLFWRCQVRP